MYPQYFEGYFEFFAVCLQLYIIVILFIVEPLTLFCGILVGKRCFKDLVHALDILTALGIHSVSTEIKQIIKPQLSCLLYTAVLFNFLKLPTSFRFLLHFPACASVLKRSFNLALSHIARFGQLTFQHIHPPRKLHNQSHLRSSLSLLFCGLRSSNQHCCFLFWCYRAQIQAWRPAIRAVFFCVVAFIPARQTPGYRLKSFQSFHFKTDSTSSEL